MPNGVEEASLLLFTQFPLS